MRCRVGDLAITVRSEHPERLGLVVMVVAPSDERDWLVEWNGDAYLAWDDQLRPLRDTDEPDETLFLAGKPNTSDRIEALRSAMRKERA